MLVRRICKILSERAKVSAQNNSRWPSHYMNTFIGVQIISESTIGPKIYSKNLGYL